MTQKKTKKQVEEELTEMTAERDKLVDAYNQLMGQAQALQKLSNDRLMTIRLLETFTNSVLASSQQLRNDMTELNLIQQQEEQVEAKGDEN
tara:strand:- start:603 stop:875 length:273 start_codon:yes stop_codon:yes gene_type:complete